MGGAMARHGRVRGRRRGCQWRRGADLVLDVPVTYPEATLGATVEIPTPDGSRLSIKVAPGTEDGKLLRMRGHGVGDVVNGGG